jgi:hypothetical protein
MTRHRTTIRLLPATREQLDALKDAGHGTMTAVIEKAVYLMYLQEIARREKMKEKYAYIWGNRLLEVGGEKVLSECGSIPTEKSEQAQEDYFRAAARRTGHTIILVLNEQQTIFERQNPQTGMAQTGVLRNGEIEWE